MLLALRKARSIPLARDARPTAAKRGRVEPQAELLVEWQARTIAASILTRVRFRVTATPSPATVDCCFGRKQQCRRSLTSRSLSRKATVPGLPLPLQSGKKMRVRVTTSRNVRALGAVAFRARQKRVAFDDARPATVTPRVRRRRGAGCHGRQRWSSRARGAPSVQRVKRYRRELQWKELSVCGATRYSRWPLATWPT